jgi:hypothetical protein
MRVFALSSGADGWVKGAHVRSEENITAGKGTRRLIMTYKVDSAGPALTRG